MWSSWVSNFPALSKLAQNWSCTSLTGFKTPFAIVAAGMRFLHPCGWHSEHHCSGNKPMSFMECSNCFVFARSVKPPNASRVVSSLITNGNRLESFEISSSVACVGMANEEALVLLFFFLSAANFQGWEFAAHDFYALWSRA